ncbi:MAG: helix-turn-helix transcriptional regulator [Candidatus Omnitrophica bacterium]|nr:helix-turn-helix transcriptional regulator [Candidatus Omnitrophota bacterium]
MKFKVIKKNKSTAEVSFDGSVAYDSGGNFLQTHCIFQELRNPESGDEELDGIPADEEGPSHNPDLTTLNLPPKLQFASLTPREIEVCELIRKGLSIKEIAHFLKTSPRTVESHRNHICKKLGFSDKKKNLTSYLRMGYELKCGLKIHRILL